MILDLFPQSYEASRQRFLDRFEAIKQRWPSLRHEKAIIDDADDLSIDWFIAEPNGPKDKVLIFTIAEHGIEGYVGSAMLELFLRKYLPLIDPETTGLLLIHAVNPWGMKYHRRVNPDNIDLNRTFLINEDFDENFNPGYDPLRKLIRADVKISNLPMNILRFFPRLLLMAAQMGWTRFNHDLMLGQYKFDKGLFYGGKSTPKETAVVKKLLSDALKDYPRILHLDMHTGYGPRYQMSMVNSVYEPRSSEQCVKDYKYPLIVAANPQEFYAIKGDLIDYIYELRDKQYPDRKLYGMAYEFGTYGDDWIEKIRMPFAMHYENALRHQQAMHHYVDPWIAKVVENHFEELFNPAEEKWKKKAVADGDQAFEGILRFEGYIE